MKLKYFKFILLAAFLINVNQVFAKGKEPRTCVPEKIVSGIDAWPFGCESEFPWKSIQGLWRVKDLGLEDMYFTFKVTQNSLSFKKIVQINQYSNIDCSLNSWGVGEINFKNTVVKSLMTTGETDFMMTLRSFSPEVLNEVKLGSHNNRAVTVMTLYPLGQPDREFAYKLQKVSSKPTFICYE